jgi:hypothetical protein
VARHELPPTRREPVTWFASTWTNFWGILTVAILITVVPEWLSDTPDPDIAAAAPVPAIIAIIAIAAATMTLLGVVMTRGRLPLRRARSALRRGQAPLRPGWPSPGGGRSVQGRGRRGLRGRSVQRRGRWVLGRGRSVRRRDRWVQDRGRSVQGWGRSALRRGWPVGLAVGPRPGWLPAPGSAARQPMRALGEAEAALTRLVGRLRDSAVAEAVVDDAWLAAVDTATQLRVIASSLESVALAVKHVRPEDRAPLRAGAADLGRRLDEGLRAYRDLIAAAGRVLLASATDLATNHLVEATERLSALADALTELAALERP